MNKQCFRCLYDCKDESKLQIKPCKLEKLINKKVKLLNNTH